MNGFASGVLFSIALSCPATSVAQNFPQSGSFSRKNTFTLFAEYSNTSSHILMGSARQRKLADFGGGYARRVVRFWGSDLSYQIELRPVLFESDPVTLTTQTFVYGAESSTSKSAGATVSVCYPSSNTVTIPLPSPYPTEIITTSNTCGRQWTFGQEFSPIGFKYSMRTRHPLQPFIIGTLGYMYTSRPVPVVNAEAFNFVFDFGAGVELYRSDQTKRSVSLECRYHHFSNRNTAPENPGTDNIVYKLSYSFGH